MTDDALPSVPKHAMVLAAGLGKRMRPITETLPKPLVPVAGRPLIDHILDALADAGVEEAVVNVHYLADLLQRHVKGRAKPQIIISDERELLLDSGGGVKRALPELGPAAFFVLNSDSFWIDGPRSNLLRMAEAWDPARMDVLMLVASTAASTGYDGIGDFAMDATGLLRRRREREVVPFVYAGVLILKPDLFDGTPNGPFSLNLLFDRAAARGRLFGLRLDGYWLHVGTPDAIGLAEERVAESAM
jgi:MurNAc alpha-1-phosphate uridylyltransferase